MKNQEILTALEKLIINDYHFSELEFQDVSLDRREILIEKYKLFVKQLQAKLSEENHIEEIHTFITKYVTEIDSQLYFKREYEILLLKLNEISYWIFGISFPIDYYNENTNLLSYCC